MTPPIHPGAHVDPKARLAEDVRIGPGTVIGPDVELGAGVEIGANAVLEGRVVVGPRCRIGHGCVIGGAPQDLKFQAGTPAGVRIGEGTDIREHVVVHHATHAGEDTVIGAHCLIMAQAHVAHDCVLGDHVIIINLAGLAGHVVVEDRATVGGLTGIHPFTRIGRFAYVGGVSKVTRDVPPFVLADGVPVRARGVNVVGMRRAGVDAASRRAVQRAYRILYRSGLRPAAAAHRLREDGAGHPLVVQLADFVLASARGVVPGGREEPAGEGDA